MMRARSPVRLQQVMRTAPAVRRSDGRSAGRFRCGRRRHDAPLHGEGQRRPAAFSRDVRPASTAHGRHPSRDRSLYRSRSGGRDAGALRELQQRRLHGKNQPPPIVRGGAEATRFPVRFRPEGKRFRQQTDCCCDGHRLRKLREAHRRYVRPARCGTLLRPFVAGPTFGNGRPTGRFVREDRPRSVHRPFLQRAAFRCRTVAGN